METNLLVSILGDLAKMSPVIAILLYFVVYFKNKVQEKENEIKEMYKESRDLEKENINVLNRLSDAIDSLKEYIKR